MHDRCLIIAEAGVNHNGQLDMALELVDRAAEAGADYVKFQTFQADLLATETVPKAAYQQRNNPTVESQHAMLKRLELSHDDHRALIARCKQRGIGFLSTPFDPESLEFLASDLGLDLIKLGSGELTNGPLLLQAARTGAQLIVSTGMSTLAEVEEALAVVAFGCCREGQPTSRAVIADTLADPAARMVLANRVTLLHCTTEYPARPDHANLKAMATMRSAFGVSVGYSDHSLGTAVTLAAVALGATIIEKHFTLDPALPGPDHAASLTPEQLSAMVSDIRSVEQALGDGIKQPALAEISNRAVARKCLVASRDLPAGHRLEPGDMVAIRRGNGLSPMAIWDFVGLQLVKPVMKGEPLGAQTAAGSGRLSA